MIIHDRRKYEEEINELSKTMNITSCPGYLDATMVSFETVQVQNTTNNCIELDTSVVPLNRIDMNNLTFCRTRVFLK